jgi:hypothetical protein
MEMKVHEHLQRHLILVFDRSFAGPEEQWSVDELDYQLQFITALIDGEKDDANYFSSPPPENTSDNMSLPSFLLRDSFVYVVSLICFKMYSLVDWWE